MCNEIYFISFGNNVLPWHAARCQEVEIALNIRTRKFIGAIALLTLLTVYAFIAMMVAIALQVNASKFAEVIYYFVAGLAWTIPAGAIIWWMQKPD